MARDNDEPLDEPFVKALVVPGSESGSEAVDVLIAWNDWDEISETAEAVLPMVADSMQSDNFSGEVTISIAEDFLEGVPPEEIAALEAHLQDAAGPLRAHNGRALKVRVKLGTGR